MTDDEKALRVEALAKELGLDGVLLFGWEEMNGPAIVDPIIFYAGSTPEGETQAKKMAETIAVLAPRFNQ